MTKIVVLRGGQIQSPASSAGAGWVLYILLLMPGLGLSLFAQGVYPPVALTAFTGAASMTVQGAEAAYGTDCRRRPSAAGTTQRSNCA